MNVFLKRITSREESQAGLLRGDLEEGIVVTGDDSSRHFIAPETFQWDKI